MYDGEAGIDSGGLTKDWFLEIASELVKPQYALFKRFGNGAYDINAMSGINEAHLLYFQFFGRLMAKAVMDRQYVLLRRGYGVR